MIIPVKCFTCGKVIGNKYLYYLREVRKLKLSGEAAADVPAVGPATAAGDDSAAPKQVPVLTSNDLGVSYLTKESIAKTPEGIVLDRLKMRKPCCRRHFLTHVDIE